MNFKNSLWAGLALMAWGLFLSPSLVWGQPTRLTQENILKAIENNRQNIANDSLRPGFHLAPLTGFMADPNGGVYHNGWYHIFYMHSPFGLQPEKFYWAHFRSRDLLRWENMKPAVLPAYQYGTDDVSSGSSIISKKGIPLIFYAAGQGEAFKFWRAVGSPDLTDWKHEGTNPVLTLDQPGIPNFDTFWRDPFVFTVEGRTFLICCADLFDSPQVGVPIFEARNDDLTSWEYKGTLFDYPKYKLRNFEVSEFRQLGDKWIFLASCDAPIDKVVYFTGTFDLKTLKFTPEFDGQIDYSGHFYAQETLQKDRNTLHLIGWIPGWDRGWLPNNHFEIFRNTGTATNGCFSIPRELTLDPQGAVIQKPAAVFKELRTQEFSMPRQELAVTNVITRTYVSELRGNQMEINAEFDLGTAAFCGMNVLCDANGFGGLFIMWSGNEINIDGIRVPIPDWKFGEPLQLQIFVDKTIVEVFVNGGRHCVTRKVPNLHIKGDHVALTVLSGTAKLNYLKAWKMKSVR